MRIFRVCRVSRLSRRRMHSVRGSRAAHRICIVRAVHTTHARAQHLRVGCAHANSRHDRAHRLQLDQPWRHARREGQASRAHLLACSDANRSSRRAGVRARGAPIPYARKAAA
eukprot:1652043-Pleurochrysis_carterae.AAC.1